MLDGIRDAVQVVAGFQHYCVLDRRGRVDCRGSNASGQLGGAGPARPLPQRVPGVDDARDLAAAEDYACAVRHGGEVVCWGRHPFRARDASTATTPVPGLTRVSRLLLKGSAGCALLDDGSLRCWQAWPQPAVIAPPSTPFSSVRDLALGHGFQCALVTGGRVWCKGSNDYGQLGDGTKEARGSPVEVQGLSDVDQIATDGYQVCARLAGGTVRCWGRLAAWVEENWGPAGPAGPDYGIYFLDYVCGSAFPHPRVQLHTIDAPSPTEVPGLDGVVRLASLRGFIGAVRSDGTLTRLPAPAGKAPSPLPFVADAVDVSGSDYHDCLLLADRRVACWGSDDYGQLGTGALVPHTSSPAPAAGLAGVEQVVSGRTFSCARLHDGAVRCWGSNEHGQLGDGGAPLPGWVRVAGLDR
jgi:hypothetical protein